MAKYRIVKNPDHSGLYWVEKKFFFGWWKVTGSALYFREAEHFVESKMCPVVKEYP